MKSRGKWPSDQKCVEVIFSPCSLSFGAWKLEGSQGLCSFVEPLFLEGIATDLGGFFLR